MAAGRDCTDGRIPWEDEPVRLLGNHLSPLGSRLIRGLAQASRSALEAYRRIGTNAACADWVQSQLKLCTSAPVQETPAVL